MPVIRVRGVRVFRVWCWRSREQARQIVVVVVARLPVLWRDCWCCCCQVSGAGVVLQMLFG